MALPDGCLDALVPAAAAPPVLHQEDARRLGTNGWGAWGAVRRDASAGVCPSARLLDADAGKLADRVQGGPALGAAAPPMQPDAVAPAVAPCKRDAAQSVEQSCAASASSAQAEPEASAGQPEWLSQLAAQPVQPEAPELSVRPAAVPLEQAASALKEQSAQQLPAVPAARVALGQCTRELAASVAAR